MIFLEAGSRNSLLLCCVLPQEFSAIQFVSFSLSFPCFTRNFAAASSFADWPLVLSGNGGGWGGRNDISLEEIIYHSRCLLKCHSPSSKLHKNLIPHGKLFWMTMKKLYSVPYSLSGRVQTATYSFIYIAV